MNKPYSGNRKPFVLALFAEKDREKVIPVLDALENIEAVEAEYADKYKDFCDKFCYLDDGHASERIVKKVFGI